MSDTENSRRIILAGLLSLVPLKAAAQIQLPGAVSDYLNRNKPASAPVSAGAPAGAALSQNQIGAGLKDAMKVASRRTPARSVRKPGVSMLARLRPSSSTRKPVPKKSSKMFASAARSARLPVLSAP